MLNSFRKLFSNSPKRKARRAYSRPQLLQLECRIVPAPITVLNTNDSGVGSLRQAIIEANNEILNPGADDIVFAASLTAGGAATINLSTSGDNTLGVGASALGITSAITITGPTGANGITLNNTLVNQRLFYVSSAGNLTLDSLTLSGGNVQGGNGGGILNGGTLTVTNSTLSGNTATTGLGGGISNGGTLNINNSTISGNTAFGSGGILGRQGTLTINNSTISGNTATTTDGGGIKSYGTLTVNNSTISGNTATSSSGGGIVNFFGTLSVSNSTISGNTAGNGNGGGISNNGTATVSNSTLYGNTATTGLGGGILNSNNSTLTLTNSTLSGNTATNGGGGGIYNRPTYQPMFGPPGQQPRPAGILNIANTIIANSTNGGDYAGGGTVNLISGATAANNLVSQGSFSAWATTKTSAEINLGTLANNGGPTQTLALLNGSAAIGTGNATISNATPVNGLDQRGVTRSSTAPSIGAYEAAATAVAPTVTSNTNSLAVTATTLIIAGTGFDTTPSNNTVTFNNGAVGNVSSATANQLTVNLTTPPNATGSLTAIVTTNTISSGTAVQVANILANTTTTLTSSTNPSVFGQSVTFTATVAPVSPGVGTAAGTVQFFDNGSAIGSAITLTSGSATSAAITNFGVSTHSITAVYSGDSSFITSTSTAVSQVVNKASTTTALTSSTNPSVFGQSVTFTATVATTTPGAGTAAGTVQFFDNGNPIGTAVTISSGSATSAAITNFGVSTHSITAVYSGDSSFVTSTSTAVSQVVNKASTTTTLASTTPSVFGQSVTFTATIAATSPGAGTATGTVQFFDNGNPIGTAVTISSGSATSAAITNFGVSTHSITAVYSGDSSFVTSTSSAVSQVVNKASTTTTLASTTPSVFGQSVTFTATIAATSPGAGTATGTVQFFDNGSAIGSAITLTSGSATSAAITNFGVGTHSITAVYSGDSSFITSTSTAVSQVVNKASTTTTLASTTPSVFGQSVTFTATVAAVSPGAGTATGTVQFFDNGSAIGSAITLTSGSATSAAITNFGVGTHSITAVYSGDSSFITSTSTAVSQVVNLGIANTPAFGSTTSTTDGFTVQITNYDPNFTYGGTATANGTVAISSIGLVTVTGLLPNTSSTATITTTQTNFVSGSAQVTATSLAPTAPLITGTPTPPSSSGSSTVNLYDAVTGQPTGTAVPFPGFNGAVKVVSGDFDGDGVAELIAGAGFGGGPAIAILNSQTGEVMESFFAFDPAFTGGVFVAVQDTNGDGILDIIASAGPGGGPEVRIFNGANLNVLRSFFAYAEDFTGGVSVASIDFNGDGILDLVTGAGPGGAPHVKVFDGATNAIISQWYAYPASFTGGVFVAVGDIGNNGTFEVVTGAGLGGAPVVAVWDPFTGALLAQFMAYTESFTGGVRVGVNDGNGDGTADIITGAGPGGGPHVKAFSFPALDLLFEFYSGEETNPGGVFVS